MRSTPHTLITLLVSGATLSLSAPAFAQQPGWGAPPAGGAAPPPAAQPAQQPAQPGWGFSASTASGFQSSAPATPPPPEDDYAVRRAELHQGTTLGGSTGLMRVASAQSAPVGTFRLQAMWDYSSASSFLCNDRSVCASQKSDKFSRFGTNFTGSATVARFLETYAGVRSYATSNDQGKPELLQVLGDMTLGLKFFQPAERYRALSFAGDAQLLLLNGSGSVGLNSGSTSFRLRGNATVDLRQPGGQGAPLLIHLNAGYKFDNSGKIVNDAEARRGRPVERIERFGLGINRVDFAELGIAFQGVFAGGETIKHLQPFLEYTIDVPVNRQGYKCNPQKTSSEDLCLGKQTGGDKFKVSPSRLTAGLRFNTFMPGIMFTVAGDLGTSGTSRFIEEVSPQTPWTLWFGAGFAFDAEERPPVVKVQEVQKIVQSAPPPSLVAKGTVHETGKTEGVAGAVVTYQGRDLTGMVTDAGGRFTTSNLEPGTYTFAVKADGYKDGTCTVTIAAPAPASDPLPPGQMPPMGTPPAPLGQVVSPVDCALEALPKVGHLLGQVVQGEGAGGVGGADVTLVDAAGKERTTKADSNGNYRFDSVAPGPVKLHATHPDYLGGRGEGTVEPRKDNRVVVSMNKRPKTSSIVVGKREIIIRQQVRFERDSAKILSDSSVLLMEIADALQKHPEIKLVEIQGHTDNSGTAQHNKDLSEQRAAAVKDRLVSLGVSSSRLTSKGFGAERPIVPNVTEGNRARNRRVALVILQSDK
ncbi:MAG: OmpA family protein [Polyangiaceae bacterium]|nr:OmpA family protein [Polyangiaceae bacterium]